MRARVKAVIEKLAFLTLASGGLAFLAWKGFQMSFRIIKEWIFTGLRRHRERHGQIVASNVGECTVVVRFRPTKVLVYFVDHEPPIDPCHPHDHDTVDDDLVWIGGGRWGVKIKWSVFSTRHIKYEIEGIA